MSSPRLALWRESLIKANRALCKYPGLEKMTMSIEGTCTWENLDVTQPSLQTTGLQKWHYLKDFPWFRLYLFILPALLKVSFLSHTCGFSCTLDFSAAGTFATPSSVDNPPLLPFHYHVHTLLQGSLINTGKNS